MVVALVVANWKEVRVVTKFDRLQNVVREELFAKSAHAGVQDLA